jgi:hypothetical protein
MPRSEIGLLCGKHLLATGLSAAGILPDLVAYRGGHGHLGLEASSAGRLPPHAQPRTMQVTAIIGYPESASPSTRTGPRRSGTSSRQPYHATIIVHPHHGISLTKLY